MAENTNKYSEPALALLKANLGFFSTEVPPDLDAYLKHLLNYAHDRLDQTAGICLTPGNLYDDLLQVMYTAWIYRKGGDGAEKPPMLQKAIRDYQVGKAMADAEVT